MNKIFIYRPAAYYEAPLIYSLLPRTSDTTLMYIVFDISLGSQFGFTYLAQDYQEWYDMDLYNYYLYALWLNTNNNVTLLIINITDSSISLSYTQKDQHPIHSLAIDDTYDKIILGATTDQGNVLITKTPIDKIVTQSLLKNEHQNSVFVMSEQYEYYLNTFRIISSYTISKFSSQYFSTLSDLDSYSNVSETVVYLNFDAHTYQIYQGNIDSHFYNSSWVLLGNEFTYTTDSDWVSVDFDGPAVNINYPIKLLFQAIIQLLFL